MTKCTACVCYKVNSGMLFNGIIRKCTHPKGVGKLISPRTPKTCPLKIKYRFAFTIVNELGDIYAKV